MNTKHTPGPWIVSKPQGAFGWEVLAPNTDRLMSDFICQMTRHPAKQQHAEANARLIAAAPELLSALEGIMKWWMETPSFAAGEDDMPADLFDGARAAINKAKGETP